MLCALALFIRMAGPSFAILSNAVIATTLMRGLLGARTTVASLWPYGAVTCGVSGARSTPWPG
jgi:hypothetical protein